MHISQPKTLLVISVSIALRICCNVHTQYTLYLTHLYIYIDDWLPLWIHTKLPSSVINNINTNFNIIPKKILRGTFSLCQYSLSLSQILSSSLSIILFMHLSISLYLSPSLSLYLSPSLSIYLYPSFSLYLSFYLSSTFTPVFLIHIKYSTFYILPSLCPHPIPPLDS